MLFLPRLYAPKWEGWHQAFQHLAPGPAVMVASPSEGAFLRQNE
jgi:hypothetical protein